MNNVLVVSAHPGDTVIGCGGALALHAARGDSVKVLVVGDGWTSRVRTYEKGLEIVNLEPLEEQERNALKLLDVTDVSHLRLPDNRLDSFPLLDLVKHVEQVLDEYAPDVIYTNSRHDLSVDQQRTCRAVVTSARPVPGEKPMTLLSFESPSSTEWNVYDDSEGFTPDTFVDISSVFEQKMKAVSILNSETRPWPHPRSIKAISACASVRGVAVGFTNAEAFKLLRKVVPGGREAFTGGIAS